MIKDLKNAVNIPVIGNGDVKGYEDYIKMINAMKSSAMGLSCVVSKDVDAFSIKVNAAIYKKKKYFCKYCNETGASKTNKNKNYCQYCCRSPKSKKGNLPTIWLVLSLS